MDYEEHQESKSKRFRRARIEVKLRGYPGIYKVRLWNEDRQKYVDIQGTPSSKNKPYRVKRRVKVLGKTLQISKCFDSIREAKTWRDLGTQGLRDSLRRNEMTQPHYTVGHLIADWRAFHAPPRIRESSYEMYAKDVSHMKPLFEMEVQSLSAADIDDWIRMLVHPSYPKQATRVSFMREVETLGSILRWYREYKNPSHVSPMLRRHRKDSIFREIPLKEHKALTQVELTAFLEHLKSIGHNPLYYYLASFQALTGTRIGEVCGLMWDAVDLENRWVTIKRIVWWNHISRTAHLREGTKTGTIRNVFLCEKLVQLLREWKAMNEGTETSLVFHRGGEPLHYQGLQNAYNRAFKALKLPYRSTHILRHTFATLFVNQTGNREALRSLLGHRTFSMTEKYAHTMESTQAMAMQQFEMGRV